MWVLMTLIAVAAGVGAARYYTELLMRLPNRNEDFQISLADEGAD